MAAGVTLLLLVAGGYLFGGDLYVTLRDLAVLRQERASLTAEVERLQTELAVERATRIELEAHATNLNEQVAELNGQVKFLLGSSARGKGAK
jgi:cell division protein FtsB